MPNWCYNHVEFSGPRTKELLELIKTGKEFNNKYHKGWLPEFLLNDDHLYLFEISSIHEREDGSVFFVCETKWSPPMSVMEALCRRFELSVDMEYSESDNGVFGRYLFADNKPLDFHLDPEDYDRVEYDSERDSYICDGKPINSDTEMYEYFLWEKMKRYYAETNDPRLSNLG